MKIKIAHTTAGVPVITNALTAVNGRAQSATASAVDVLKAAKDAENQLEGFGISKAHRVGAEFIFVSGGKVAKSYKYSRIVNVVKAVRGGKEWFIVDIAKATLWPNESGSLRVGLTSGQTDCALAQTRAKFYTVAI